MISRFTDAKKIGLIASGIGSALLLAILEDWISPPFSMSIAPSVLAFIALTGLILIWSSVRKLKRTGERTKANKIGNSIAFLFGFLLLLVFTFSDLGISRGKIFLFVGFSSMSVVVIPYSFYLFKRKSEEVEMPMTRVASENPTSLKLPSNAWPD